jgi:hypothetical protein
MNVFTNWLSSKEPNDSPTFAIYPNTSPPPILKVLATKLFAKDYTGSSVIEKSSPTILESSSIAVSVFADSPSTSITCFDRQNHCLDLSNKIRFSLQVGQ